MTAENIIVIEDFLSESECRKIINEVNAMAERARWIASGGDIVSYDSSPTLRQVISERLIQKASERNSLPIREFRSYLRKYEPGSIVTTHADCSDKGENDGLNGITYSALIYLNDDYCGGELNFDRIGVSMRPMAGQLIMFPSSWDYAHSVTPITDGFKYMSAVFFTDGGCDGL
jgi:predicted 2-oxoglutarate/Fe(II)-dependent dioxygenase YbiX